MKVLHIGDVAGIPQTLVKLQRELGYKSDSISFQEHPFSFTADFPYKADQTFPRNYIERMRIFSKYYGKYDMLHFHGGALLPKGIDSILWRSLGKRVIIHHHGTEIRTKYANRVYSLFANEIIVSTPDLLDWCPSATWIPNPILLDSYPYVGVEDKSKSQKITIVHAPSNRLVKGTNEIIRAIDALKEDGFNLDLVLVENVPHSDAVALYEKADIAIDQLLIGWYGVFSMECMALGKPVCVYIRNDLKKYLKCDSITNVNPNNLKDELRILIEDAELRMRMGKRARGYVEKVHDGRKIAKIIASTYLGKIGSSNNIDHPCISL